MILNKLKISLDIDDTIAGFSISYKKRFKTKPKYDWCISRNVNNILINEKDFWLNLPVIRKPNFNPILYCTSRISNKRWTKQYLENNDFPKAPVFQVPGYNSPKSKVLKGRCSVHIEDSPNQWKSLNLAGIPCLLIDSPNNKDYGPMLKIYSLDYEEIEDAYNLALEMDIFKDFKLYYEQGINKSN